MATIGSMIVNVLANTTGFASGMTKVRGELAKTEKAAAATQVVFSKFGAALGTIGIGISGAAVISNLRNTAQEIDNLAKTADRLGISTEAFKGLEFGAGLAGISSEQLAGSLQFLTKQIGEAAHGAGKAKIVFQELGVDVEKLASMTPEQQLGLFADLLKNVKDETERTRIAMRIFGGDGAGMLNFLAEGSDAIKGYIREAKELGLTYSREEAARVEAFNDAWERLSKTLGGISKDIVIDIAPAAFDAIEYLREVVAGVKEIRRAANDIRKPRGAKGMAVDTFNTLGAWFERQQRGGENVWNSLFMGIGAGMSAPAFNGGELPVAVTDAPALQEGWASTGNASTWDTAWFEDDRRVDVGLYRKRASLFLEGLVGTGSTNIERGFKAMGEGLKSAESFGKNWQRQWLLGEFFPREGPVDRFFADKEREDKRKIIEVGMEANRRMIEGIQKSDKFGTATGINQAIEAGTVEAFRALAESRIQREMLQAAKQTNQELAELNRNLAIDMTGLN